jgi:hypothetical protein
MRHPWMQITSRRLALCSLLLAPLLLGRVVTPQAQRQAAQPIVVSVQMVNGTLIYRVNGKRVEDNPKNSLLTNLGNIANARGLKIPVFIIVDVRAPFSEVGKLETALDKVDLTYERRLFVTDFRDGLMNEIHWDHTAIPIPKN